jgi:hypothetical protein
MPESVAPIKEIGAGKSDVTPAVPKDGRRAGNWG